MWAYLQEHPAVVSNMVKHVDVVHVAELLEKLIVLADHPEDTYLAQRQALLGRLLNVSLNKSYQGVVVENVAQILNEIVLRGREAAALIETINKPNKIFQFGLATQSAAVLQLVVNLLEYAKQRGSRERHQEDDVANFDEDEEASYSNFYECCKEIASALASQNVLTPHFETSFGAKVAPITPAKLTLLQLLLALLQTGDSIIIENIFSTNIFGVLKALLLQHPFNNQLQIAFEKFVTLIFSADNYRLLQQKLCTEGLLDFIAQHNAASPATPQPGYRGVLTKLSNMLLAKAPTNTLLQQSHARWVEYVRDTLQPINKVESQFLCGVNPRASRPDYDDELDVQRILDVHARTYTHHSSATLQPEPTHTAAAQGA